MSTTPRILVLGAEVDAARLIWESVGSPESLVGPGDESAWLTGSAEGEFSAALILGEPLKHLPMLVALESVVKHLPEGIAVLVAWREF